MRERRWPQLKTDGVVGDDVELQVVTGNGWDQATRRRRLAGRRPAGHRHVARRAESPRVFLGSRGSKILRHSPVPVLVLPG